MEETATRIDRACDRFEDEWLGGAGPRIETYLASEPDPDDRTLLLRTLLRAEVELRREEGESPARPEYEARFPEDPDAVAWAFRDSSTTDLAAGPAASRFRKLRAHARGGLGVVSVAFDAELNREVALKEILGHRADDPESRRRFVLEAEVTGNLEHPGIVPVYGLGRSPDGRPYYAMRLIRGESLKAAIAAFHEARTGAEPGAVALHGLLRRFLDVCNAVDYAHSRGILHRDIKPSNVMLGKHGETLVLDWGLAKALGRPDGPPSPADEPPIEPSSSEDSALTQAGSKLGTWGYMSPEQAQGQIDRLGPASDVYSLGATLYEILTGCSPFPDSAFPREELIRKILLGDYPRPRERARWVDPALEAICGKAMALRPSDRYPSCRRLADDLERWLVDEPVEAWREPWPRRAWRFLKRHRTGAAVAAATSLVAIGLLGGAGLWLADRARRSELAATAAIGEAERLADQARWGEAVSAAERARDVLEAGGGGRPLRRRVAQSLRDLVMLRDLDAARLDGAAIREGAFDRRRQVERFRLAFRSYGVDLDSTPHDEAARRIRAGTITAELADALLEMATYLDPGESRTRLVDLARRASPSPRQEPLRAAVERGGDALGRLPDQAVRAAAGDALLAALARSLIVNDEAGRAVALLRPARGLRPGSFWINHDLGVALYLSRPPSLGQAHLYLTAAEGLRPDSPAVRSNLGLVLSAQGEHDAAVAAFREALRLDPEYALARFNLANTLAQQGKLDEAVLAYREALASRPDDPRFHLNLGIALARQGRSPEAIAAFRRAIACEPGHAESYFNLGLALWLNDDLDAAIAAFQDALARRPDYEAARRKLREARAKQALLRLMGR